MKTWIIVLAIVYVVLKLATIGLRNYIRNDRTERIKYYFSDGTSTLGAIHSICALLSTLTGCTCIILLLIYLLNLV